MNIVSLSLRRSGQHAVLNWICKQRMPSIYFGNCQIIRSKDEISCHGVYSYSDHEILSKELEQNIPKMRSRFNDVKLFSKRRKWSRRYYPNIEIDLSRYNTVVWGFEDPRSEAGIPFDVLFDSRSQLAHKCGNGCIVVVLRDVLNWYASRKSVEEYCWPFHKAFSVWEKQIRLAIDGSNFTPINFNRWYSERNYREGIAYLFDMEFTDAGFTDILSKSQFNNLNVFDRWQTVDCSVVNQEAIELSKHYFGVNYVS